MGKSTISMAIFNSYVKLPEGIWYGYKLIPGWWLAYLPLWKIMEWKSVGMMIIPNIWKVIKFHGSIIDYYIPLYPIKNAIISH